jgi:ADP-ribosyl-[dinitrogen reductase] hydrolase
MLVGCYAALCCQDEEHIDKAPASDALLFAKMTSSQESALSRLQAVLDSVDLGRDREQVHVKHGVTEQGDPDMLDYCILQGLDAGAKSSLVECALHDEVLSRAMGSVCGMAVGDALGHPFEFIPATDDPGTSFFDLETKEFNCEFNKFHLERGQWTDDASMGLCMADSLIMKRSYDGGDMRTRFWCWWFRGYNNAFRRDKERASKRSIGLGGNVASSLAELSWLEGDELGRVPSVPDVYEARSEDSGNGSLMRLAPVPVFFCTAPPTELHRIASLSSQTTHPGIYASEACAVLAHVIASAITRPVDDKADARSFLDRAIEEYVVASGLKGKTGPGYDEMRSLLASAPLRPEEGCWDWRSEQLRVESSLRARGGMYNGYPVCSDYFGSYSIDGLAVALWAVYNTRSFDEAVVKSVNVHGDADSHGSITGQIAGAFYGYSQINRTFLDWLKRWDDNETAVKALLLYHLGLEAQGKGRARE